jgi:phage tail protein X
MGCATVAARLAIAVTLGILARARRSRGLAIITAVYAATAGLAAWDAAQPALALGYYPDADPAVLLPAAVLLIAGAGFLLAAARRPLRPPAARVGAHTPNRVVTQTVRQAAGQALPTSDRPPPPSR